jgi:heat-inducible transcriptional repressor
MSTSGTGRGGSSARPTLSERNRRILATLVREYIERGEPVSSLWLAEHCGLDVSSATVRNVLAVLEEFGLVRQPHTSAGRVPTDLAYRLYVDQLLESRRPMRPTASAEERLRLAGSVEDVLDSVSQELSRSSTHLGFVLARASRTTTLKHIDFVVLSATRVLVVVVATSGHVSHKPVTVKEPLTPDDLSRAARYLNEEFGGKPLDEIRLALTSRMFEERATYDRLLARILELTAGSFTEGTSQGQLFVHGTSSLVDQVADDEPEVSMTRLRSLLGMIEEKHRLLLLLTEYIDGPGLTVIIGGEHLSPELQGYSLVASSLEGGEDNAAVGVIGPTRMRYPRAISAVERAARLLGRVLADPAHPNS